MSNPRREFHSAFALPLAVAICAGLIASGGCETKPAPKAPAAASEGVPVTIATAIREDVPVRVRAIGWVESYVSVTVKPQVEGQIVELNFSEGQDVNPGDALIAIDPRPYDAALRLAEANLARDRAMAENAQREYKRVADLFEKSQASTSERDQYAADADAKAAQVRADEAEVERARLNLEYCTIRAPISGRLGSRMCDRGNIVKAGETELVLINQVNPIYVTFSVPEQYLAQIKDQLGKAALRVEARSTGDAGPPESGELTFIDNQVDKSTGMLRLKATFANDGRRLWPGQFVNTTLTLTTLPSAVTVPTVAVQAGQGNKFVYIVKADSTVEQRPVKTGLALDGRTVIDSGLTGDETIVTDGHLRLTPGAKVAPKAPTAAAGAGDGSRT